MKNNNPGCLAYGIIILIVLFVIGLVIEYWYIVLALIIIAIAITWYKSSHKSNGATTVRASVKPSETVTTPTVEKHSVKHYLPKLPSIDDIMDYTEKKPPVMAAEGHKFINTWTGHNCAAPQSIQQTYDQLKLFHFRDDTFKHLIDLARYNHQLAIQQYLETISTPYYEGGLLAYKRGDYDLAELWLAQSLPLQPVIASQRLAIIYRKECRYKDMTAAYINALKYVDKLPKKISISEITLLTNKREKAAHTLLGHLQDDESQGIPQPQHLQDDKFIEELNAQ